MRRVADRLSAIFPMARDDISLGQGFSRITEAIAQGLTGPFCIIFLLVSILAFLLGSRGAFQRRPAPEKLIGGGKNV